MEQQMVELKINPFIKCIAIKLGLFESEIIDEYNFGIHEEDKIEAFEKKYCALEDCIVVRIDMW